MRSMLASVLQSPGFTVFTATEAREASARVKSTLNTKITIGIEKRLDIWDLTFRNMIPFQHRCTLSIVQCGEYVLAFSFLEAR